MDSSEFGRIRNLLDDRCPGQVIAPWPHVPEIRPLVSLPPATSPPATTSPAESGGSVNCSPSYPTVCIPPPPPDFDCGDIPYRNFPVLPPDPHRFDGGNKNGIGCEST